MKKRGKGRRSSVRSRFNSGVSSLKKIDPKSFFQSIFNFVRSAFHIIGSIIFAFFILMLLSFLFIPAQSLSGGNIAVIPIKGIISTSANAGAFSTPGLDSASLVELLKRAEESEVVAVILEINSPGGSPVATEEIAYQIKKMEKPIIAVIREVGASGAYWIASAADKIYANRMSLTGSIGVVASHLEFAGLLRDYNVTYRRLVAGEFKDTGSPYREMSEKEIKMFQGELDTIHDIFINEVAMNRNLSEEAVRKVATGWVFLGEEAKELGLVDEIGLMDDVVEALELEFNITAELVTYESKRGFFDLFGALSDRGMYFFGRGFASSVLDSETKVQTRFDLIA